MDLLHVIRITLRRFYIAGPLIALSLLMATRMSGEIQPEYTASASYLLVGPGVILTEVAGMPIEEAINPYLNFPGALNTTSDALRFIMAGTRIKVDLAERDLSTRYDIGADRRSPLLTFVATSEDPEVAVDTVDRLGELLGLELDRRQSTAGAPDRDRIDLVELATNFSGPDLGRQQQVKIMVGVLGGVLSVTAAAIFDGAAQAFKARRRARRGRKPGDDQSQPASAEIASVPEPDLAMMAIAQVPSSNGHGGPQPAPEAPVPAVQ